MTKTVKQLLVKIEQAGTVSQKTLMLKDGLTFGHQHNNDIVIAGDGVPKKAKLVSGRRDGFDLYFSPDMKGEVLAQESRLSLQDLVLHGLLQRSGNAYRYPITPGKKGAVVIGNAKIVFQCVQREVQPVIKESFSGYSWGYVTLSRLKRDLPFKIVFATVAIFHFVFLNYLSGLPVDLKPKTTSDIVPERLARIIVKAPDVSEPDDIVPVTPSTGEEAEEAGETPEKSGQPKPRKVENQGLLGLLTGSGQSNQSNNLADFLLDEGLVQELDAAIASTDLSVGNGRSRNTSDGIDDLLANSDAVGGIDDLLSDVGDVGGVGLSKKGQIKVDQVSSMRGSEEALGSRTEESVRNVLLSNQGRIQYIYNKLLRRDPNLSGKVVVEVVIAASGNVAEVKMISSTMNNADFERELIDFIRSWRYDPIQFGSVTVTLPLFFNKVG